MVVGKQIAEQILKTEYFSRLLIVKTVEKVKHKTPTEVVSLLQFNFEYIPPDVTLLFMLLASTCSCSPVQRFLLIGCFKPREDGPAREITKCIKFANWVKIPTVRNICTFVVLF